MTKYGAGERSFLRDESFFLIFATRESLEPDAPITDLRLTHAGPCTVNPNDILRRVKEQYLGRPYYQWRAGSRDDLV